LPECPRDGRGLGIEDLDLGARAMRRIWRGGGRGQAALWPRYGDVIQPAQSRLHLVRRRM